MQRNRTRENLPRGLISFALSKTRNGILALWSKMAKVRPPMPPPEIKTLGLLKSSSSSPVKEGLDLPDILIIGGTGVAYSMPGIGTGSLEDPGAGIFRVCDGGGEKELGGGKVGKRW